MIVVGSIPGGEIVHGSSINYRRYSNDRSSGLFVNFRSIRSFADPSSSSLCLLISSSVSTTVVDQFTSSVRYSYRMLSSSTSTELLSSTRNIYAHRFHNSSPSVCNFRSPAILPLLRHLSTSSSSSTCYPSCLWWSAVVFMLVVTDCNRKLHRVELVPLLHSSFHHHVTVRFHVCHFHVMCHCPFTPPIVPTFITHDNQLVMSVCAQLQANTTTFVVVRSPFVPVPVHGSVRRCQPHVTAAIVSPCHPVTQMMIECCLYVY